MAPYTVIDTVKATDTNRAALAFGFILAVEKGVPNEVQKHARGHVVIADDRRAVLFTEEG